MLLFLTCTKGHLPGGRCGSSGRAPAQQVQGPEFKPWQGWESIFALYVWCSISVSNWPDWFLCVCVLALSPQHGSWITLTSHCLLHALNRSLLNPCLLSASAFRPVCSMPLTSSLDKLCYVSCIIHKAAYFLKMLLIDTYLWGTIWFFKNTFIYCVLVCTPGWLQMIIICRISKQKLEDGI
jgi:hypothetical protein